VAGNLDVEINAFGANEPFDAIRAESSGPVPVWTWVFAAIIVGWSVWYGLASFSAPEQYASTPTYERDPVAAANAPMSAKAPAKVSGRGVAAGFDYPATGERLYAANCASCHGASGAGVPGAFPPLAGDAVITAEKPDEQVHTILAGLKDKPIAGKTYASQMPAFAQLSDADIAAIVDHERTSWGNHAPIITPDVVKRAR
jgi:mono/diheme cytochrome c family protein